MNARSPKVEVVGDGCRWRVGEYPDLPQAEAQIDVFASSNPDRLVQSANRLQGGLPHQRVRRDQMLRPEDAQLLHGRRYQNGLAAIVA